MIKGKISKLFLIIGMIFFSGFMTGCSESKTNSVQKSQEYSSIYDQNGNLMYQLIRFDKQPRPISDWELYDRDISIVKDMDELNNIFTSYIGEETTTYFSNDVLKENIVLFIMRYEDSRFNIGYYNFYVDGNDLYLTETLIDVTAEEVLTFYMDFVIIPKTDNLSDLNIDELNTKYNWIIHDEWKN